MESISTRELTKPIAYTLTEIANLTGFSDQSPFTHIVEKRVGQNPSEYRKQKRKGKANTKS